MTMFRGGTEHLGLKKKGTYLCESSLLNKNKKGRGKGNYRGLTNSGSFISEYLYPCIFYNLSQKGINLYLHFAVIMQLARENIILSSRT